MLARLTLRVARGGGGAGLLRLLLMVLGIALGVAATIFVAVTPGILDERAARSAERLPVSPTGGQRPNLTFSMVEDSWHGVLFTRILVADVQADAPSPPGVAQLPQPGEMVLSPAAARLVEREPELRRRLPGRVTGTIGPAGILGPDELYAYVGVTAAEMGSGSEAVRFGLGSPDAGISEQFAGVGRELALLILPTVLIYLLVAARLAAATRSRRYAALRLLGMRRGQIMKVAAAESASAGVAGAIIGVLAYQAINPVLADTGVLGFSWFAGDSTVGLAGGAVAVLVTALLAALAGVLGLRQSIARPVLARSSAAEARPRNWLVLPLVVGVGLMTPALLLRRGSDRSTQRMDDVSAWLLIGGLALAVLGCLLALRPFVAGLGATLAKDRWPASVRIAGNRMICEPSSAIRLLAGPVLLVLVAGVGAGVLRDGQLAAGPTLTAYTVTIDGGSVPDATTRQRIYSLPAERRWVYQTSEVDESAFGKPIDTAADRVRLVGLSMVMATCDEVRALARSALPECQDGQEYRFGDPALAGTVDDVPAGLTVTYVTEDGSTASYTTPSRMLAIDRPERTPLGPDGVIVTRATPKFGWSKGLVFTFVVGEPEANLESFKSAALAAAPGANVRVQQRNLQALEAYRAHRGTINFGVLVGFVLCLAAFLIASLDRLVERRRDVVSLVVLGMRLRSVRVAQLVQLAGPLIGGLALALAVGYLGGNAWLRLNGRQHGWYEGTLTAMAPLVGVAVAAALVIGLMTVGRRLRAEDIRRE